MKTSGYLVCFLSVLIIVMDLVSGNGIELGWVNAAIWSYLAASNSR